MKGAVRYPYLRVMAGVFIIPIIASLAILIILYAYSVGRVGFEWVGVGAFPALWLVFSLTSMALYFLPLFILGILFALFHLTSNFNGLIISFSLGGLTAFLWGLLIGEVGIFGNVGKEISFPATGVYFWSDVFTFLVAGLSTLAYSLLIFPKPATFLTDEDYRNELGQNDETLSSFVSDKSDEKY